MPRVLADGDAEVIRAHLPQLGGQQLHVKGVYPGVPLLWAAGLPGAVPGGDAQEVVEQPPALSLKHLLPIHVCSSLICPAFPAGWL